MGKKHRQHPHALTPAQRSARAREFWRQGHHRAVIGELLALQSENGKLTPEARALLARAYVAQAKDPGRQIAARLTDLGLAGRYAPQDAALHFRAGILAYRLSRWQEAAAALARAAALQPGETRFTRAAAVAKSVRSS